MVDINDRKFQWSQFSQDKSEQFVIRTDDWDELMIYRGKAKVEIGSPTTYKSPAISQPTTSSNDASWCPIHQTTMKQFTKNGQSWFSHKAGDQWCNGRSK